MSQTSYHYELLKTEYKILKYVGVWTENKKIQNTKFRLIYLIWTQLCLFVSFNVTQFVQIFFVIDDIPRLADICYALLAMVLIQIFSLCMYIHRREIDELDDIIETEPNQMFTETHKRIVEKNLKIWKTLRRIQYIFIIVQIIFLIGTSITTLIKQEKVLPFNDLWVPFDINKSPNFEYVFFVQNLATVVASINFVAFENVVIGYFSFIATQCDLLCHNLRHVKEFPSEDSMEFQLKLGPCVQQYIQIMRFKKLLIQIMGTTFFSIIMVATADLCLCVVVITVDNEDQRAAFQMWFLMEILNCLTFLMPCWFASRITAKSEPISYAIFESSWTDASISFKKSIISFCQQTQQPIEINFMSIFSLSLPVFVIVVQRSFSFYTMLTTIHEMH